MNQKGLSPILIIILIAAVLGGFLIYQKQAKPASQPTPAIQPISSPTPDETANWKTYTNTKYGFSFKYPVSMSPAQAQERESSDPQFFVYINHPDPYFEFSLSISTESKETIEKDFGYLKDRNSVKVAGIETTEYAGYGGVAGTVYHQRVLLSRDNLTYQFSAGTYDEKVIFDQILSTFKFTE